ncbi:MAG: carboxylesterase/lipase family protein [Dehalococcoidia bacterium]
MTPVQTTCGLVEGISRESHAAYYGIPFAASAAEKDRFRAPAPPPAWDGVRETFTPGLASPQTSHAIPGFAASGPQGEDCLSLNAFTPAADGAARPVLFWIHGGGFTHGAGSDLLYDGGPLAVRGDVVVVTINYRLGALGYLYLRAHLPAEALAVNAGQLDMIAALHWVRDNIAAFGGDPANVTIFGESAGAAAVGTLLAMPAAKGLFHKAILQSGTGRAIDPERAARVTGMLLDELGLGQEPAGILTRPVQEILAAQAATAGKAQRELGLAFGPVLDPQTLPRLPFDAIAAGVAADIPVLIGTNRDEVKLFNASIRRDEIDDTTLETSVAASLRHCTPAAARELAGHYRQSRTARGLLHTNLDILDAVQSDARFRVGALRMALAQAAQQPMTFVYLFTHESPARRGALGSCHALEMPFVFGTLSAPTQDRFAGTGPAVERLSHEMMDAWISFARTGSPAHEGIGPWPAYDADTRPTMVFDTRRSAITPDPFSSEREAIEPFVA